MISDCVFVDRRSNYRHAPCMTMASLDIVQLQEYRREVANLIEVVTTGARCCTKGVGEVNGKSTSRPVRHERRRETIAERHE